MYEAGQGGGAGGAEGRAAGWAVRRGRQRPGRGRGGEGGAPLPARAPTFHLARLRSGVERARASLPTPAPSNCQTALARGRPGAEGRESSAGDGVPAGAREGARSGARVCVRAGRRGKRAGAAGARAASPPLRQSGKGMGELRAGRGTRGESHYLRRRVREKLGDQGRERPERATEAGLAG